MNAREECKVNTKIKQKMFYFKNKSNYFKKIDKNTFPEFSTRPAGRPDPWTSLVQADEIILLFYKAISYDTVAENNLMHIIYSNIITNIVVVICTK